MGMTTNTEMVAPSSRTFYTTEKELRVGFPPRCTDALGVGCSSIVTIVNVLAQAITDGVMSMEAAEVMVQEAIEMAEPCQGISSRTLECGCVALRAASSNLVTWYDTTE